MVNSTVFKKEWREQAWKHVLAIIILSTLGISLPFIFDWLVKLHLDFGGQLGEIYRRQISDFAYFMWANWYGKNLYQFLVVYAVVVGMSQIAGEIGRNTAGFLFTKPLDRELIYRSKFVAGATVMVGVVAVATTLTYLSAIFSGKELTALFLAGLLVSVAGMLVLYSMALMLSVVFNESLVAGVAAIGAALALGIPGWIPGYGMYSLYRQMHAMPVYAGDGFQLPAILVMLLTAWLFYRIGLNRLLKKDL